MVGQRPAPAGVDITRPNVARIYDYWLGGKDNFPADREVAEKVLAVIPDTRDQCRANREFLRRVVRMLAESGVRQFIDVGTGLPTQGQAHHIAHEIDPGAQVLYVDNDPVVLAHARALLQDNDRVTVIQADLREPEQILEHPETRANINFAEPYALLLIAILHFVPDQEVEASEIVKSFRDAMAPGSYVAVSHITSDGRSPAEEAKVLEIYNKATTAPMVPRTRAEVTRLFDGFELVDPGIVDVRVWGQEGTEIPSDTVVWAAVGKKP